MKLEAQLIHAPDESSRMVELKICPMPVLPERDDIEIQEPEQEREREQEESKPVIRKSNLDAMYLRMSDEERYWYEQYITMQFRYEIADEWMTFDDYMKFIRKNHVLPEHKLIKLEKHKPIGPKNVAISRNDAMTKAINAWMEKYKNMKEGRICQEWNSPIAFLRFALNSGIDPSRRVSRWNEKLPYSPDNIYVRPKDMTQKEQKWFNLYFQMRRKYGAADEWKEFSGFLAAMDEAGATDPSGITIADPEKPFGPDNWKLGANTGTGRVQEYEEPEAYQLPKDVMDFYDAHEDDLVFICRTYLTKVNGDMDGFGRFEAFAEWTVRSGYRHGMKFYAKRGAILSPDTCSWRFPAMG